MGFLEIAIIFLNSILLLFCVYRISDLSSKLSRVRKRYDRLLRGRGELNLEELLSEQAEDIERTKSKLADIEQKNSKVDEELNKKRNLLTGRLERNIQELDNRLSGQFNQFTNEAKSRLNNIENSQKADNRKIDEKLERSIDNLNKSIQSNFNEAKSEANTGIRKLEEQLQNDFSEFTSKNREFGENLVAETHKSIKMISDQMAFAVQRVALNRYNALQNQSGDLSFTIVLLDQFNNGIMLTCINGRDSSYTYSKHVKNGKTELDCSPEEEDTLRKVLN